MTVDIPPAMPDYDQDRIATEEAISDALYKLTNVHAYTLSEDNLRHFKRAQLSLERIYEDMGETECQQLPTEFKN